MLESVIQFSLVRGVRDAGGVALKLDSASHVGVPDLLVILGDRYWLVEVKQDKGRLSKAQAAWHAKFHSTTGNSVVVLYGIKEVRAWLATMS